MVLAIAAPSVAQVGNQGQIEGVVTDQSGAVVQGASLTANNTATGISFAALSDENGIYRFAVLPVGSYDITIGKAGFSRAAATAVKVDVGSKIKLDLKLAVSAAEQTINVSAQAPLVETTRTQVSSTVDDNFVRSLPVNGRNFIDFVLLTPGVTRDIRTGDISFGGQRGTLNSLTVDGADNNNTFFGQTSGRTGSGRAPYQFSQDAVQEFQVNSNGYSAELGRAGGAVINVVTKSGTNRLHGALFEYYRDRGLTATDPIVKLTHAFNPAASLRKPGYHFHQFGGNAGGPIVKNRAFFFFDYDGQRNTQLNVVSLTIPAIAAPTAFQAQAISYLQARSGSWIRTLDQDTFFTKLDWAINAKHQLSGRWNRQNFSGLGFENGGPTNAFEHSGASLVRTDTYTASLTSAFTPAIINVGRFSFQKDDEPGLANSPNPEAVVKELGQTLLVVGRNSFSPRFTNIQRQQYADTVTFVRGRHGLKVGADYLRDQIANFFPGNFSGAYSFTSLENFGRSLAGQPLINTPPGAPGSVYAQAFAGAGTTGPTTHPDLFEVSWFVQDDWKPRNNLSVNLGLRWDLENMARPRTSNPVAVAAGIRTDVLHIDKNNYGPRFGFAWTPWADERTVIRGGYGIFYGRTPSIMVGTAHSNNGVNVGTKTFSGAAIPSYPSTLCGPPVDMPSCPAPAGGALAPPSIYVFQPDYHQPRVQQANLGLEWSASPNVSFSIGGLMVKGNHLQRTRDINLGTPVPSTIAVSTTGQTVNYLKYPAVRPIAAFTRISQFESSANSIYYGLISEIKKRMSRNFQGQLSYTWSHVIDDVPDATAVVPFSSGDDAKLLFDPRQSRGDRASGANDQRQRLVISGIWDLSHYADGANPTAKVILGGWELATIFAAQTGQRYTGRINSDLNNDSNSQTDRVPSEGRNRFVLPNTWSVDSRVSKSFNFTESVRLQLLVEAFNLLNHFNTLAVKTVEYSVVGGKLVPQTTGINAFGVPAGAGSNLNGARIFQLGAKIIF